MFGWFRKREPARIAKPIVRYGSLEQIEQYDAPPGETEKMVSIQQLCWIAGISAETVAHAKAEGRLEEEWARYDFERYRRLRAECIELGDTITDGFYRAVVLNYLIEVCMKARDIDDARALFEHQEIRSFRDDTVAKYPELVWPTHIRNYERSSASSACYSLNNRAASAGHTPDALCASGTLI
jgi:pentatricopeptide repeat protein